MCEQPHLYLPLSWRNKTDLLHDPPLFHPLASPSEGAMNRNLFITPLLSFTLWVLETSPGFVSLKIYCLALHRFSLSINAITRYAFFCDLFSSPNIALLKLIHVVCSVLGHDHTTLNWSMLLFIVIWTVCRFWCYKDCRYEPSSTWPCTIVPVFSHRISESELARMSGLSFLVLSRQCQILSKETAPTYIPLSTV